MRKTLHLISKRCVALALLLAALTLGAFHVVAHPLGNFTINHFTRMEVGRERVRLRFVVDMAEISTFQEMQAADTNGDGHTSDAELNAYLEQAAKQYASGLVLNVDGSRLPLQLMKSAISTREGAGNMPTLRIECDYEAQLSPESATSANTARHLRLEDMNHSDRIGWREMVAAPVDGMRIFNSNVFGSAVTNELNAYPQDMLAAPLDERVGELSFTMGAAPANAQALKTRDGRVVVSARDSFAELITVQNLTLWGALLGLV